jgi:hypothetical protein
MAKTISITIALGSSYTGLSLAAQIVDVAGNLIETVLEGFVEIGEGFYLWTYTKFADNFFGGVKFFEKDKMNILLSFTDVNTQQSDILEVLTKKTVTQVVATAPVIGPKGSKNSPSSITFTQG